MGPKESHHHALSTQSPLQDLPPELLHHVFSHLPIEDILTARKTCSILASIGLDYFGDEVALVYHRDKF